MTSVEFATAVFTLCNVLRVLAYVPQILRIAQDADGARAVSCGTWGLFAVSHLATVYYTAVVARDTVMAALFGCNVFACLVIVGLTLLQRHRSARSRARIAVAAFSPAGGLGRSHRT
ncbi:MAG: hypothetical protein LCH88_10230 [Proteobacteria bacterium]|nr:hypothetical protein [Pseudomonadota bacterium]